ncbi:ATP-binding protein [Halosimplex salinum]|uniref:ATP-binding protein n=1 Tax=Halosimplex salinum TaxID=1710538 RepID=UPI000F48C867|nr:ATP-binding protein [Halosimplex salinum]
MPVDETELRPTDEPEINEFDRRRYVEIRPTDTPLSPRAVTQAMEQFHSTLDRATQIRLRDRLRGDTAQPSIEWLLVADGNDDTTIRYLVGATEPELHDELKRICRTAFPNTYELQTVAWHPEDITNLGSNTTPIDLYESATKQPDHTDTNPPVAGVDYHGRADRPADWQTPLTRFADLTTDTRTTDDTHRLPLTTLVETMRDADAPIIYQVLCRPYRDITPDAEEYELALEDGTASLGGKLQEALFPRPVEEDRAYEPPAADKERLHGLADRDAHRTFQVTARAVVFPDHTGRPPTRIAESLATALGPVDGPFHHVEGEVRVDDPDEAGPGTDCFEALCERVHDPVEYERTWNRIRRSFTSPGLVTTPEELPGLCLLDGAALTPTGQRAVGVRNRERTGIALPEPGKLRRYRPPGMALVQPLTSDRQPVDHPLVLPPEHQPRHQVIVGDTGSGKSVLTIGAMLSNIDATDGPDILFDYKGGGTAQEYLRTHYRTQGNLDDVRYFDLTSVLPAFSFFDIGPLLDAGLPREEARSRKTGHYEEILRGAMPAGQYDDATESPRVIRNHLRALYDPVHGSDAFGHTTLYDALQRTQGNETPPPVSESTFETYFTGLLERDRDVFTKILGGAISRVETIATDARLAPLFDHVPEGDDARFDFNGVVDEDTVIIFDFGGMETRVKRTLTLVLLSNLWTALKAREERTPSGADTPQVNLYLEEAKDVADTELVDTLLAQGRSFDLSVTLGVQFLEQLDSPDPANNTYREALNETATFVVGNVAVDRHLPDVLATGDMSPSDVERRLGALGRGEWLVRPGADFGDDPVRPLLGESLPAPPGHPASDDPLRGADRGAFEAAVDDVVERTTEQAGIELGGPSTVDHEFGADDESADELPRVDTLLPYTKRLPDCVGYDDTSHAIRCEQCENRYNVSAHGMMQAIDCCHSMTGVDPDDFPICELNLSLSSEEIVASDYSPRELCFMQAVYNAQQNQYDRPEYDIARDSMIRIQEYAGIETDDVERLIDDGLVTKDTDRPYRLYSLTPDGRAVIQESHSHGVAFGHGKGDLDESAEHVLGVEVSDRWATREFAKDPDSDVVTIRPYYDLKEGSIDADAFFGDGEDVEAAADDFERHRLDLVGLDEDGEVVLTIEVERINHDTRRAVPEDYDKMAACDPEEAIWVVMSHTDAHEVLAALNDPLEGEPRVEKTYSEGTPAQSMNIDEPGFTDVYTVAQLRDEIIDE